MDFNDFALDAIAEEGRWFSIGKDARIKIRSAESKKYKKVLAKMYEAYPNFSMLSEEMQEELISAAMADGLVITWENFEEDGTPVEPTRDEIARILKVYPVFRRHVANLATSVSNFQQSRDRD